MKTLQGFASAGFAAPVLCALTLLPTVASARYIGADPPRLCDTCGAPPTSADGSGGGASLTEGNLTESHPVLFDRLDDGGGIKMGGNEQLSASGNAPPITSLDLSNQVPGFELKYNSYNADGLRAQIDSGLGYGWTHTWNSFVYTVRGHFFRMDADGRVTKYGLGALRSLTADTGYFETFVRNPDGSFTITDKYGTSSRYAAVPGTPFSVGAPIYRLTQRTDRNGNTTTLSYSGGNLVTITDTYGRSLLLGYNAQKKLIQVTDPLGRVTRFDYDATGRRLVKITDPLGKTITYSYNAMHQPVVKTDEDGRVTTYVFGKSRPAIIRDGTGAKYFHLTNPGIWRTDDTILAQTLRRFYIPGTTTRIDGRGNAWLYDYNSDGYPVRSTAPDGSITTWSYDPATRQRATVTDPNGNQTSYTYDSRGNPTSTTNALGQVTTYTYEPVFNQMTSTTDPNGRTTSYTCDARGNMTRKTDALGQLQEWTYDSHGKVLTDKDRRGNTTAYTYDATGNRTQQTDALGNITTYSYDAVGNMTSMTDPNGHTTSYGYDARDRRTTVTDALGHTTTTAYDGHGNVISTTDRLGRVTACTYDHRNRPVTTTDALGQTTTTTYDANDNVTAMTDRRGNVTTYTYDTRNRLVTTTDALSNTTTTTYDANSNILSTTDANGHTTTATYDALNRRSSITNAAGYTTSYEYDAAGCPLCSGAEIGSALVAKQTDGNGKVTYYKYDALNRLIHTIRKEGDTADVVDPSDAVTSMTYDPNGNVLTSRDPNALITTYTCDALNRRTMDVNPAGDTTTTTYDPAGNAISTTAPNGNVTTYTYDVLDRRTMTTDSGGTVTTTTYDAEGNRLSIADGNGNTTPFSYDTLNRRIQTTDPLLQSTTTTYDANSNVIQTTDREGHSTTSIYDSINRRTSTTDALGHTTTFQYDPVGNRTGITDANGHATQYGYDAINRVITETLPDPAPNAISYSYDAVNRITRTDQQGRTTQYIYNDLYHLVQRDYPVSPDDNMTYDRGGRMLSAERGGWIVTNTYDAADRVVQRVEGGRTISYSYNIPGRTRTITYPSGRVITETADARGRLVSVHDGTPNPPLAVYAYDAANRVLGRIHRNGTSTSWTYNANDWILTLEHFRGATRIAGFAYACDDEGNKLYESKLDDPADSEAYAYDSVDRLASFDVGTLSGSVIPAPVIRKTWNLDPVGNWSQITTNAVPEVRTHNDANELTTINGSPLHYDDSGNLRQDTLYTCSYDEEDRLTAVRRNSDSVLVGQYFYDALGRRVSSIASAGTTVTTVFLYDGLAIIEERDASNAVTASYTCGSHADEMLTMDRGGQTYWYHANALGSPAALTDAAGAAVERYSYDAYGSPTILTPAYAPVLPNAWGTPHSPAGNPRLYTGREHDEETGFFYYRARTYDPGKGRFLQRDSLNYADGMNLYVYVRNSPVNLTDPSGLVGTPAQASPARGDRAVSDWVKKKQSFPARMKVGNCCYRVLLEAEWEERQLSNAANQAVIEWRNLRYVSVKRTQPVQPIACTGREIGQVPSWGAGGPWQQWNPTWGPTGRAAAPEPPDNLTQPPSAFSEAAPAGTEGSGGYAPQMLGD